MRVLNKNELSVICGAKRQTPEATIAYGTLIGSTFCGVLGAGAGYYVTSNAMMWGLKASAVSMGFYGAFIFGSVLGACLAVNCFSMWYTLPP